MPPLEFVEDGLALGRALAPEVAAGAARWGEKALSEVMDTVGFPSRGLGAPQALDEVQGFRAASELEHRLSALHPDAPMRGMISAALHTDDAATLVSVNGLFKLPTEARGLLSRGDIQSLTGLIKDGTPGSLAKARSTLGVASDLGAVATPDRTVAQILNSVKASGVGDQIWLGHGLNV